MISELLTAIEDADLPAPVYRTVRRFLDATAPGSDHLRLEYPTALRYAGTDSENTLRGHLVQLHAAGLILYQRNAVLHVFWNVADRTAITEIEPDRTAITKIDGRSQPAALPDRTTIPEIAERSQRSTGDHKDRQAITPVGKDLTTSKQVGKEDPTYLPALSGAGEPPPLTDQERSVDLLTDSAVGCTPDFAAKLAAAYPFAQIRLQVFQALRQMAQPGSKVKSIGVIKHRLQVNAGATVTDADRASALWLRHETEQERAEERERKYSLDGLTSRERFEKYADDYEDELDFDAGYFDHVGDWHEYRTSDTEDIQA